MNNPNTASPVTRSELCTGCNQTLDEDWTYCPACGAQGREPIAQLEASQPKPQSEVGLREALEEAVSALKDVRKDTFYAFDSDFTPEEQRLIPRLEKIIKDSKRNG